MNNDVDKLRKAVEVMGKILNGQSSLTWEEFQKGGFYAIMPCKWEIESLRIYRASFINENDDLINIKSRYSYPPKELCNKAGRCHLADYPVFYGASDFLGAIQETIITRKNKTILQEYYNVIYVSEWEMPTKKNYIAYNLSQQYPMKDQSDIEIWRGVYQNFLNQLFRSEKGHGFSSGFSFMLMYGVRKENKIYPIFEGGCKAMIYPTVVKNGIFTNYALHPSIIDNHDLELNRIFKLKIPVINWYDAIRHKNAMPMEVLKVGKLISKDSNLLLWTKPDVSDNLFISRISKSVKK